MAEYVDRDIQLPLSCPRCRVTVQISLRSLERCDVQRCLSCGKQFQIESARVREKLQDTDRRVEEMLSDLAELLRSDQGATDDRRATPDTLGV